MVSEAQGAAHPSQSVLTIDLGAIAANFQLLRARVAGGGIAAVLKADAYGLGAVRVGPALAAVGCADFFVAHLGEGIALRGAVGAMPRIYVLNGLLAGEEQEFLRHGLVPALNDLGQIQVWSAAARQARRKVPAVVNFDTGMSRLGLTPREAGELAADPARLADLDLRFWMSHLACADEPEHALNRRQLNDLKSLLRPLPKAPVSFANSSGIFLGPDYHFDLVRPGCALYGINPLPGRPNPMKQVATLATKVLQIRTIDRPQTVGYGATHQAAGPTRVATIAAGYADGWLRSLSNRGFAVVNGAKAPFIGRVSMDLITIDATALPDLKPGDPVHLMDEQLTSDHVGDLAGTIGYEVLTRIGARFHRHYLNDPSRPPA
jgi:alanine racemase